jgi:hypothetical protein
MFTGPANAPAAPSARAAAQIIRKLDFIAVTPPEWNEE